MLGTMHQCYQLCTPSLITAKLAALALAAWVVCLPDAPRLELLPSAPAGTEECAPSLALFQ